MLMRISHYRNNYEKITCHSLNEIPTFNDQQTASDGENPSACRPVLDGNQQSSC